MGITEEKTLIYWLNTLDLPSALLVDSLQDLRDGLVLFDLIGAPASPPLSNLATSDASQRISAVIAHLKPLDPAFAAIIGRYHLRDALKSISQAQPQGDQLLLHILRALHRLKSCSRDGHRAAAAKPKQRSFHSKKPASTKPHSSLGNAANSGRSCMRRGGKTGGKEVRRRPVVVEQRAKVQVGAQVYEEGGEAILRLLRSGLRQDSLCMETQTTVKWLLRGPLLPTVLRQLEGAGVRVGVKAPRGSLEEGLTSLVAWLFADGVLLCMIVAMLERLAGTKLKFVEKHSRHGKVVVLRGLELEPKTHGAKLRNVNIALELLKRNPKVAPRHLFAAERFVSVAETPIAIELLSDIRLAYKTPGPTRHSLNPPLGECRANLLEGEQGSQSGPAKSRRSLKSSNGLVKANMEVVESAVEGLVGQLKPGDGESLEQWAIHQGLITPQAEYLDPVEDPLCNGIALSFILGISLPETKAPLSCEEATEIAANALRKVPVEVKDVDFRCRASRKCFAETLLRVGRPACLALLKASKDCSKVSSRSSIAPLQKKPLLTYSKADLDKLEESLNSWLVSIGAWDNSNCESFLNSKVLATGELLAIVTETILKRKILGIFPRPRTASLVAKNIEKCLEALRQNPKVGRRFLFKKQEIVAKQRNTTLGLFEDLHRFYAGLPARKEVPNDGESVFLGIQQDNVKSSGLSEKSGVVSAEDTNVDYQSESEDLSCNGEAKSSPTVAAEFQDILPREETCSRKAYRPPRDAFGWPLSALERGQADILPSSSGWWQDESKENVDVNNCTPEPRSPEANTKVLHLCRKLHVRAEVKTIDEFCDLFANGVRLCQLVQRLTKLPIAGVQLKPKSKAARLHNIRAALKTLQKFRQMPSDHLWDEYEVERSNPEVVIGLLEHIRTAFGDEA